MLLVGDIHINAKYKDLILSELKDKILSTKEKYIIFLGDYVYHFVYDKKSLSELFKFFLKLFSKGRKVIVLAGNHDWINQTFVFEEVADLVKILSFDGFDIIVKPQILEVDGKQCLFLPYNIYLDWNQVFEEFGLDISKKSIYDTLINSSHKGERYSGYLNKFVEQFIEKYSDIYIFHHFYFSDIDFVGQKGKFTFKDVSLDGKKFLRQGDSVKFISGHLHQPFAWRNYFCTGSVWATTPLEYNQYKFLFKFDWEKFEPIPLNTNYYLRLEYKNGLKIDENLLKSTFAELFGQALDYLRSGDWKVADTKFLIPSFQNITINLESNELSYDNLPYVVDPQISNSVKEIKIKRKPLKHQQVVKLFVESEEKLQETFKTWKELLFEYLKQKYGKDAEKYIDKLRQLGIV